MATEPTDTDELEAEITRQTLYQELDINNSGRKIKRHSLEELRKQVEWEESRALRTSGVRRAKMRFS